MLKGRPILYAIASLCLFGAGWEFDHGILYRGIALLIIAAWMALWGLWKGD